MSTLLDSLNWRYAAKRMNGNKIPKDKLNFILESIRLTPTSLGLQPIKVIVTESNDIKNELLPACFNQLQIVECSHLLIFCVYVNQYENLRDDYLQLISQTQNMPLESLDGFKNSITLSLENHSDMTERILWAQKQAYIALGTAIIAAAETRVDATPMEGFNPSEVDRILNLPQKNLHSTLLLPLGYRDEKNDFLINMKKVRKSSKEFFEFL